jgi:hypothetical protein
MKEELHLENIPTFKDLLEMNMQIMNGQKEITDKLIRIEVGMGEMRGDIKLLKNNSDNLPCAIHTQKIEASEKFQNNLKGKMGIIGVICIGFGGLLVWLAEEIIKKTWFK